MYAEDLDSTGFHITTTNTMSANKKPTPLSPTAARTVELMNTRTNFRKAFEENLGWFNSVKLEEGVYFQYPDSIEVEGSQYLRLQAALKEIIDSEPELAQEVKAGTKDLEALEGHPKSYSPRRNPLKTRFSQKIEKKTPSRGVLTFLSKSRSL
ncbi:hypothetical protein G9A89_022170 [Geosiphon pyriformis]|nr:hypothetical protein G9A89_022170 [Geosiphon pyriformis]